jgi:hypothetical protein
MRDKGGRMNIGYLIFHPSSLILSRREVRGNGTDLRKF